MEYNAPASLVTPGPDITFNAGTGDAYILDPDSCTGLDQAPLRTPIDDAPQTDGAIVHDFLRGPRYVTLGGLLRVRSASSESGYISARNALEANLISALESIEAADGTFTITPTGQSAKALTVRCFMPVTFTGSLQKRFLFALVAADPDFT